jgi:hypothetical protein
MSDYKSMRRKKNAELQNAMSGVRKDLYDWKQAATVFKLNRDTSSASLSGRTTPQPVQPPPPPKLKSLDTNKILKKTSSMKELISRLSAPSASTSSIASSSKNSAMPPSPRTKIKPLSSLHSSSAKHSLEFSDPDDDFNFNLNENLTCLLQVNTLTDAEAIKKTEFLNAFKDKPPPSKPHHISEESNRVYLNSARSVRESRDPSKIDEELVSF